jgi:hypothetical protein
VNKHQRPSTYWALDLLDPAHLASMAGGGARKGEEQHQQQHPGTPVMLATEQQQQLVMQTPAVAT